MVPAVIMDVCFPSRRRQRLRARRRAFRISGGCRMRRTFGWSRGVAVAAAVVFGLMPRDASADEISDYPNRPINLVVGFTPGGGNDVVARIVGAKAGEIL